MSSGVHHVEHEGRSPGMDLLAAGILAARAGRTARRRWASDVPVGGTGRGRPGGPLGGVRGVDGLWVADASTPPSCIGVNPQITILAFAVRTARRIIEVAGRAGG